MVLLRCSTEEEKNEEVNHDTSFLSAFAGLILDVICLLKGIITKFRSCFFFFNNKCCK